MSWPRCCARSTGWRSRRRATRRPACCDCAGAMRRSRPTRFRQIFLTHLRQVRGRLTLAALCTLGVTATELLKPWPLKIVLDHGILDKPLPRFLHALQGLLGGGRVAVLVEASGAIVLIALASGVLSYLQIFITSSIGYETVYALRRALFADSLLKVTSQFLTIVGMFAIMFIVNWRVSLIALATMPFLCYSLFHLYRKTKASVKTQKKQESLVASRMSEVLSAIPLVQAFARENHEVAQFDAVTAETLRESIRVARLEAAATRSSELITAAGTAAAVLFGALQVLRGRMLPGELVLVVSYLTNVYKPIKTLAKLSTDFSKAMASADRISEVLDIEPDIQDAPDAVEAAAVKGDIVFQDVSFDYGDGKNVLRHVSFAVSPGQRLALVGASGAGKSTIVSLILRLYEPHEGAILVDGTDIRRYRRESLRRQIGIVLQQSVLFGASVRENIAYGRPDAGLDEIVAAARAANADEFIRDLEDGYDTVIGERGATLSGGQAQRIAIARAVIRDAPILILDEPMTGLDAGSEAKVREALDRLMAGKTCLMITHDLQSVADADAVLVLDEGRIVDRGTHAELIARRGHYRRLYELDLGQPAGDLRS